MVGHLRNIDEDLAKRVCEGLGLASLPPAPAAARPTLDLPVSPPLSVVANMKATLQGRVIGILMDEGSDAAAIAAIRKAAESAGASVKLVAPKVGGAKLSNGKRLAADGQLAGSPSVIFDAVAVILAKDAADRLCGESAAIEFVKNAFGHLKAIAVDDGARAAEVRRGQARQGGRGCRRHEGIHHRGEDAAVGARGEGAHDLLSPVQPSRLPMKACSVPWVR
jgi:catalase